MSHISSIGAAMFSDLSVCMATDLTTVMAATPIDTEAELIACFKTEAASLVTAPGLTAAGQFYRVGNARSFPAMGTPANIVKVPTYGSKTSSSIQGQADAPQLEIDLNFKSADWAKGTVGTYGTGGTYLGNAVGDGNQYVFRFTLLNAEPLGGGSTAVKYAGLNAAAFGIGTVQNSSYYWLGKMEALLITPSLTDAATAKLTLSIQSPFYGAYTI